MATILPGGTVKPPTGNGVGPATASSTSKTSLTTTHDANVYQGRPVGIPDPKKPESAILSPTAPAQIQKATLNEVHHLESEGELQAEEAFAEKIHEEFMKHPVTKAELSMLEESPRSAPKSNKKTPADERADRIAEFMDKIFGTIEIDEAMLKKAITDACNLHGEVQADVADRYVEILFDKSMESYKNARKYDTDPSSSH